MSDFDHGYFESSLDELPEEIYNALGRALHRWSQLEAAICIGAIVLEYPQMDWLKGIEHLRGKRGFNVRGAFDQLRSAIKKWPPHLEPLQIIDSAENLYIQRQALIHGLWGHAMQSTGAVTAIHEWSPSAHANYREVPIEELIHFAAACRKVFEEVILKAIPFAKTGNISTGDTSEAKRRFGMVFHRNP